MQIQSSGIIANIPFPVASTLVAFEDAEAMIAQTEMLAAKYPQYAKLLQSVGTLWKRSLEASKAQAAADAKKKAEEDRIAAEQQKQEEDRLAKEAETQRLAQVEQEQKAKKEEEQRLARLEELKKVTLAEQQRLAEVEQDRLNKEAEKQRLAQIEADKQQKEDEINRIAEEQRQAAQKIEQQNAELAAITKIILQQDSSERTKAFVKLGVGSLILFAGIWAFVFVMLKCCDIFAKIRERWRATLPPEERVIEVERSQTSPRDRKILVTGITLLIAGVACLVLPIAWLPVVFWLLSPLFFAAGIILLHMQSSATRSQPAVGLWRIIHIGWLAVLYALLGISACAASLVLLGFGGNGPQFMRSGWNSADIAEPAIISAVAQLSDSGVTVPSTPSLTPPERQYVQEIANLLIAKNRLWVIAQMKIEQAGSAGEFATTLDRTAEQLIYWRAKIASIEMSKSGSPTEFAESLNKVSEVGKRMADVSEAKTQTGVSTFSAVLYAALERFDSDAEVQQAMQKLMRAVNPGDSSDGTAEALLASEKGESAQKEAGSTDRLTQEIRNAVLSIPSTVTLSPSEREILEQYASAVVALSSLRIATRINIDKANSASEFVIALKHATAEFDILVAKTFAPLPSSFGSESVKKIQALRDDMLTQLVIRMEPETERFLKSFSYAAARFDSTPEVLRACDELSEASGGLLMAKRKTSE